MASPEVGGLLRWAVGSRANIVVSGGAGAGKTTLLNALAASIPPGERIVTVEDAAELRLPGDHVVRLEARPASAEGSGAVTIRDLVRNALRMRPDRLLVGEARGGEAFDLLQAMNTGHEGSLSTCHANGPDDALRRLETMVLLADVGLSLRGGSRAAHLGGRPGRPRGSRARRGSGRRGGRRGARSRCRRIDSVRSRLHRSHPVSLAGANASSLCPGERRAMVRRPRPIRRGRGHERRHRWRCLSCSWELATGRPGRRLLEP